MSFEVKAIALLLALLAGLLGFNHWVSSIKAEGALACQADHSKLIAEQRVQLADAQAQAQAAVDAKQALINQKDADYAKLSRQIQAANAARAADALSVHDALAKIAATAGEAASAPVDSCRAQDGRISVGAGLLSEGYSLVAEGVGLAQSIGAKLKALQEISTLP